MGRDTTDTPVIRRVRELVEPIASDLQLDIYDVEQRGGTMRVTLDTPAGSDSSVDLDQLALATRLISREFDHHDPIPGKYTLEVTSPGVERTLRTPAHFQREIGKEINVRLTNVDADQRRVQGVLVAADDTTATLRVDTDGEPVERVVQLDDVDRARTVFEWGPQPKPGGKGTGKKKKKPAKKPAKQSAQKQSAQKKESS
ncbi:MAG: ribosome maturation factor RimP [Ilumatobacteraceae bacterium]